MSFRNFDDFLNVENDKGSPSSRKQDADFRQINMHQEQEFSLTGVGDTQFNLVNDNNAIFKWEGPLNLPMPRFVETTRCLKLYYLPTQIFHKPNVCIYNIQT
jgi:hypothetical protein